MSPGCATGWSSCGSRPPPRRNDIGRNENGATRAAPSPFTTEVRLAAAAISLALAGHGHLAGLVLRRRGHAAPKGAGMGDGVGHVALVTGQRVPHVGVEGLSLDALAHFIHQAQVVHAGAVALAGGSGEPLRRLAIVA